MGFNLRGRNFIKLLDFSQHDLRYLLELSRDLKRAKYARTEQQCLCGKNIALLFEKSSTRTRCAFEVAAFDQGANVSFIGPSGSHIGHKESMKDTARVLGRMYDAIEYRGFGQEIVEELSRYAGVPVYNGLTDEYHPTQILADFLTIQEYSDKPLHEISFSFVGDARSNMGHSLMLGGCIMGMDVRLAAPQDNLPDGAMLAKARDLQKRYGGSLTLTDNPAEAVAGSDIVYTDVWVSMGEPDSVWDARIEALTPYQVNSVLMAATGNPRARFMHCLPAFHNRDTEVGEKVFQKYGLAAMEVTEEVFESEASIVFEQAENRMHTIKAVLVATLGD